MKMDQTDRKLLNLIQAHFPLSPEPYREIADKLGISEEDVLSRLGKMIDSGMIRRLGAIFDSRKLGYVTTLCAMKVKQEKIGEVAAVVNSYAGVTHNYLREHDFNMWFTAAAPSREKLDQMLSQIKSETGISDILVLPAQKLFKIRVNFDL